MPKKFILSDLSQNERPRERLKRVGIDSLSLQEILALIIEKSKSIPNPLNFLDIEVSLMIPF